MAARNAGNDVEANIRGDEIEILVFNGECNGAYVSPEDAIRIGEQIIRTARALIERKKERGGR